MGCSLKNELMCGECICGYAYLGALFEVFCSLGVVDDLVEVAIGDGCIVCGIGPFDAVVDLLAQLPHQFLFLHPRAFDHFAGVRSQQAERLPAFHIFALHAWLLTKLTCDSIWA